MDFLQQTRENAEAELVRLDDELAQLNAKLASLTRQREHVQQVIRATEAVEDNTGAGAGSSKPTMWQVIRDGLVNHRHPTFAIADAVEVLRKASWPLTDNSYQIVRNTILRRKDVFEEVAAGRYRVKKEARTTAAS